MEAVKVQYTVKPGYVEENKRNINKVMDALMANPIPGMLYSSYTDTDDPNTFVHINMAKDGETMARLNDVKEFGEFRSALKASGPVSPPKQTKLNLVGSGFKL
ncbi:hypothetical protein [Spongiimicrobium sp. 3-5]|uniref:hypothetical protein n=1 Tax=Spongiimicrobium sp. 3-5 TaxID=3332596 RepID=UPI00397EC3CE